MRSYFRFFSCWFLIIAGFATEASPASTLLTCAAALIAAKQSVPAKQDFFLNETDRGVVQSIFVSSSNPAEMLERLKSYWTSVRLRGFSDDDRSAIESHDHRMKLESFYGMREDEPLRILASHPGLDTSIIQLVDHVQKLESNILNLEFTDKIARRPGLSLKTLASVFREATLKSEWEILNQVPVDFARAELVRISGLGLGAEVNTFAARLLAAPGLKFRQYRPSKKFLIFGSSRRIGWRMTNDLSRADVDENRQALLTLLRSWKAIDNEVALTVMNAADTLSLTQLSGDRPSGAAVSVVDETRRLRRHALDREWKLLNGWTERQRAATLVILDLTNLDPVFYARVRRAIETSSLAQADYVKVRANQKRLTSPWSK